MQVVILIHGYSDHYIKKEYHGNGYSNPCSTLAVLFPVSQLARLKGFDRPLTTQFASDHCAIVTDATPDDCENRVGSGELYNPRDGVADPNHMRVAFIHKADIIVHLFDHLREKH